MQDPFEMEYDELMEFAQDNGIKSAKQVGILAGRAWNAIESGNYAEAATLYAIITRFTSGLYNQTYAMALSEVQQQIIGDMT